MATAPFVTATPAKSALPNFQRAFEWDDFLPARKFPRLGTRKRSKPYVSGGVRQKNVGGGGHIGARR